ncbi:discoidin domain-containing protein [Sphingobacterium lumbrici]|uniref:discoidin domain-containing protein n=1 Tax=Sphingobacterium lumbrici TaxID=2559600 RepID=UPI00112EF755|nr:discoidin domain-containing protein [Sphingobacterium lumbrici]
MNKTFLLLCLLPFFAACNKKEIPVEEVIETPTPPPTEVEDTGYTSDHEYNLNVVYFVPTDNPAKLDYERRLSDIMLSAQTYYGNQMKLNGYGFKTFGLLTNKSKKRIKIITIQAKYTHDKYTTANLSNILAEVDAYFVSHPDEKSGVHNLIILPSQPSGVGNPYVGVGRSCFWPDRGEEVNSPTGLGGLMHELGHALNLPHNKERESRAKSPNYGTALMGSGNGTYGKSPTFLTEADCAILNTNQIFQKTTSIEYYGVVTASVKSIYASYSADKQAIIASGKFTSSVPVTAVNYYLDPNYNNEGVGVGHDYNAVTWSTKVIGTDSFYVELPMIEMNDMFKENNPAELKVKLIHENGNITNATYNFNFLNNIPMINLPLAGFDKSEWSIIDISSEETTAELKPASNMIDNDNSTFWFAKHSAPAAVLPHHVAIDLSRNNTADGVTIRQRNDVYRTVKDVEVLISSDNVNWSSIGNFVVPHAAGDFKIPFGSSRIFRYLKIIVKSNHATATADINKSCIAEIGLYRGQ